MKILVLNAGSSSQKSCLYEFSSIDKQQAKPQLIWEAHIDWTVSDSIAQLTIVSNGSKRKFSLANNDRQEDVEEMLQTLVTGETKVIESLSMIDGVGHRVVHGGTKYSQATLITSEVKKTIADLGVLAPIHNPINLQGINIIEKLLGDIPQVAVFDTAFHSNMPTANSIYPLPYKYFTGGIRRYGFHGTSHQYCGDRTAQMLGQPLDSLKIITCHLGNGSSLCAIDGGISIDTTMGFTPLEGLMMGTRSGSIDPAILLYLSKQENLTTQQLDKLLNKESGLKGVSGLSSDLRTIIEQMEGGNSRAKLAFDTYIHSLRKNIGAMLGSLGGLSALVFTAGIGENSPLVRELVCDGFSFLGLQVDRDKNAHVTDDQNIADENSTIPILVIHTEEDLTIAGQCYQLLNQ